MIEQERWEGAHQKNPYFCGPDHDLIIDLHPKLKNYIVSLEGMEKNKIVAGIHMLLDLMLKPPRYSSSKNSNEHSITIEQSPLRLRKRKDGYIVAEIKGKNFLLQANLLRLDSLLPEALCMACVGKTIGEVADLSGLPDMIDRDQKITDTYKGINGGTVLKLDKVETEKITYPELIGDSTKRFK